MLRLEEYDIDWDSLQVSELRTGICDVTGARGQVTRFKGKEHDGEIVILDLSKQGVESMDKQQRLEYIRQRAKEKTAERELLELQEEQENETYEAEIIQVELD